MTNNDNVYCGVCGEDDCEDVMAHLDDEDLVSTIMGMSVCHPDGYCRKCGSSQTVYEMDTEGYQCEECDGIIMHPAHWLGIV